MTRIYQLDLEYELNFRERLNKYGDSIIDDETFEHWIGQSLDEIETVELLKSIGMRYNEINNSLEIYSDLLEDFDLQITIEEKSYDLTREQDVELLVKLLKSSDDEIEFSITYNQLFFLKHMLNLREIVDLYLKLTLLHSSEQELFLRLYKKTNMQPLELFNIIYEHINPMYIANKDT